MFDPHILFIDGEALILDKPAGVPVTRPRSGMPSVEGSLDLLRYGFQRPPGIVHRLDQDTSGCLLLARNPKAHKRFAAAFEEGRVEKSYLAVLEGIPDEASGTIYLPLAKQSTAEDGWRIVADRNGKPAQTGWELLGVVGERALVCFRPRTGRTHQIRVHASEGLGLPIVGDPTYGRGSAQGMMLHAWRLSVPRDGKPPVAAVAPLPQPFGAFAGMVAADAAA